MKAYGGVDVEIHIFLTSALIGGELQYNGVLASSPGLYCGRFRFDHRHRDFTSFVVFVKLLEK
jgi:hypothetical protein